MSLKKSTEPKRNTFQFPADRKYLNLLTAKTYRSHIKMKFEMQL